MKFSNVEVVGPVELVVLAVARDEASITLDAADASVVGAAVEIVVRRPDDDEMDCPNVDVAEGLAVDDVVAISDDVVPGPMELVSLPATAVEAAIVSGTVAGTVVGAGIDKPMLGDNDVVESSDVNMIVG